MSHQVLSLIAGICLLGFVICWIVVLVNLFGQGILHGVLGLFPPFAFLYGWVRADSLGVRKVMLLWTILAAVLCVLFFRQVLGLLESIPTPQVPQG
jgi:hypothetical protein